MKMKMLLVLVLLGCCSCKKNDDATAEQSTATTFNSTQWKTKEDQDYPYREAMLNDLINSNPLKGLTKEAVLQLLGTPDRVDSSYLFYTITQERLQFFPLHTKTLVVKLSDQGIVEWRKIHE